MVEEELGERWLYLEDVVLVERRENVDEEGLVDMTAWLMGGGREEGIEQDSGECSGYCRPKRRRCR